MCYEEVKGRVKGKLSPPSKVLYPTSTAASGEHPTTFTSHHHLALSYTLRFNHTRNNQVAWNGLQLWSMLSRRQP